jgi:hypothetical protein
MNMDHRPIAILMTVLSFAYIVSVLVGITP